MSFHLLKVLVAEAVLFEAVAAKPESSSRRRSTQWSKSIQAKRRMIEPPITASSTLGLLNEFHCCIR